MHCPHITIRCFLVVVQQQHYPSHTLVLPTIIAISPPPPRVAPRRPAAPTSWSNRPIPHRVLAATGTFVHTTYIAVHMTLHPTEGSPLSSSHPSDCSGPLHIDMHSMLRTSNHVSRYLPSIIRNLDFCDHTSYVALFTPFCASHI